MFLKKQTEVIVAGAGPVGMFAAAELSRRDVSTWIADTASRTTGMSYALGLHGSSLEMLDELGLCETILEAGNQVDKMAFFEGFDRKLEVDLWAAGGKYPFLTILPQSALERALEDWLARHKVKPLWKHQVNAIDVTKQPLEVTLEHWKEDYVGYSVPHLERIWQKPFPVKTQFVVGADGHSSQVRRRLDIGYPAVAEPHMFAVFEFTCDQDMGNEAIVVLDDDGLSVLWPLPNHHYRWSFEIPDNELLLGDRTKSRLSALGRWTFPSLDETRLQELITSRAPWFPGPVKEVLWSVAIRFEYRLAESFGQDALWLAGDSAHLGGPVGIHSMNVGLREARDLAVCLEQILRNDGDESLLQQYNLERQMEWRDLMNLDGHLVVRSDASEFVRKNATTILSCLPASGAGLRGLLDQVGLELPEHTETLATT